MYTVFDFKQTTKGIWEKIHLFFMISNTPIMDFTVCYSFLKSDKQLSMLSTLIQYWYSLMF
jgi:hypothetical protein